MLACLIIFLQQSFTSSVSSSRPSGRISTKMASWTLITSVTWVLPLSPCSKSWRWIIGRTWHVRSWSINHGREFSNCCLVVLVAVISLASHTFFSKQIRCILCLHLVQFLFHCQFGGGSHLRVAASSQSRTTTRGAIHNVLEGREGRQAPAGHDATNAEEPVGNGGVVARFAARRANVERAERRKACGIYATATRRIAVNGMMVIVWNICKSSRTNRRQRNDGDRFL